MLMSLTSLGMFEACPESLFSASWAHMTLTVVSRLRTFRPSANPNSLGDKSAKRDVLFGSTESESSRHATNLLDDASFHQQNDQHTASICLYHIEPYSDMTASKIFGIGSKHPFANHWTFQGKLIETIAFLPPLAQAQELLLQYFTSVDPIYPMIHRETFTAEFEHFWSLPPHEKETSDPDFVGLVFAMLALGSQFLSASQHVDSRFGSELYASAANQALQIFAYLSNTSVRSIQCMLLITYFLINDNHASDGWAFAGMIMRQAYAMGLHRDPDIVAPHATQSEKQIRRKLWQAVLQQDTFLTVLLSLPPSATHTDVDISELLDDSTSIATSSDCAYLRSCWCLANLVQESICSPRSLALPIANTLDQKAGLLTEFQAVHRSFPDLFRTWSNESIISLSYNSPRITRQILFLSSNYWHNVMLLHASYSDEVPIDIDAALEASHEALRAFFLLYGLFANETRTWWNMNHRAFLEAQCIGEFLRNGSLRDSSAEDGDDGFERFSQARTNLGKRFIGYNLASCDDDTNELCSSPLGRGFQGDERCWIRGCKHQSGSTKRVLVDTTI